MMYSVRGLGLLGTALGIGYIVCVLASKEKGALKTLGYVIGAVIIVACIAGAVMRIMAGQGMTGMCMK